MKDKKQSNKIIASYGWKQRIWSIMYKKRKNNINIKDIAINKYYTIYIKTDAGSSSALIGHCNHPNISKINLSVICHNNALSQYIIKFNNERIKY